MQRAIPHGCRHGPLHINVDVDLGIDTGPPRHVNGTCCVSVGIDDLVKAHILVTIAVVECVEGSVAKLKVTKLVVVE